MDKLLSEANRLHEITARRAGVAVQSTRRRQ